MKNAGRQGYKETVLTDAAPLPALAGRTPLQEAERLLGISFIGAMLTFLAFLFSSDFNYASARQRPILSKLLSHW